MRIQSTTRARSDLSSPIPDSPPDSPATIVANTTGKVEPPEPIDKLPRPVLLIAGGSSKPVPLPETIHYLTSGSPNSLGGVFHVDRQDEFVKNYEEAPGEKNVFALEYSKPFASFQHNATEIQTAIKTIRQLTGAEEIDVVAECKGAMEVRQYAADVTEGEDGIRNLVMYVPPNHGLAVAGQLMWGASKLLEKLPFKPEKVGNYTTDKDTTRAISSFNTDWEIGPWKANKTLSHLNSKEHRDKESRMFDSITVIAGEGRKLFEGKIGSGLPLPLMAGDQAIPNWSAFLPHAENFFYDGDRAKHGHIKSHPNALEKMAETLMSDGHPRRDGAFSPSQPGLKRVGTRIGLWTGSMAGRGLAALAAVSGQSLGTAGTGLAALGVGFTAWDGLSDCMAAGDSETSKSKLRVRGLAKIAQATGVGLAMAGIGGGYSAALIGGGFALSGALHS